MSTLEALRQALEAAWVWLQTPTAAVAATVIVAAVFLVSGVFKLRHGYLVAYQLADLGLPVGIGRITARAVGIAEVAVGAGALCSIVVDGGAPAVALLGGIMLLIFTGYVLILLRREAGQPCYCFSASEEPVGYRTLARNLAIFGLLWVGSHGTQGASLSVRIAGAVIGAGVGAIALLLLAAARAKRDGDSLLVKVTPTTKTLWPEHMLERDW